MVFLDNVAEEVAYLLDACEMIQPPINVFKILQNLEIKLHYIKPIKGLAGTHVSGRREGSIRPIILLTRGQEYRRRRFTISHELKHVLFDPEEDFKLTNSKKLGVLERQANSFASHLLVPEEMLKKVVTEYGKANITLISRVFGISFTAAYFRLLNSNLIEITSTSLPQMVKEDRRVFRQMQFDHIPTNIEMWKMLQIVMNESDVMHSNCLRCRIPIVDNELDCCWGCGKTIRTYTSLDFMDFADIQD